MLDPVAKLIELAGRKPRVALAFSGGIDSSVLAHLLVKQRRKLGSLRLIHIDHRLQTASAEWSRHCVRQARRWRIPIITLEASITRSEGESLEAVARDARYALLEGVLEAGEVLVTAQHRDDQVETLLLQLFRGAGVSGLSAMPAKAKFGRGLVVRPMLDLSREDIEKYAKLQKLEWVEDPSNELTRFGRNFLRHRILPLLRERWDGLDHAVARSSQHMADAARLLEQIGQRDINFLADGDGLSVAALRALPPARRRNALRTFIARAGVEMPSTVKMMEIAGMLLAARADSQPEVTWFGATMRRRQGRLELIVTSEVDPDLQIETILKSWWWKQDREFIVNGAGDSLTLVDDPMGPIDLEKLPATLDVRPRVGGEHLRPGPNARTRSLKKLLQTARLSVEMRARLPLVFDGERPKAALIAAGDRWIDASVAATVKSRRRARLVWRRGK